MTAVDIAPGDLFVKGTHHAPDHPMALYRFDGWLDVPASSLSGRLAGATWLFNGSRSAAWEIDIHPWRDA